MEKSVEHGETHLADHQVSSPDVGVKLEQPFASRWSSRSSEEFFPSRVLLTFYFLEYVFSRLVRDLGPSGV